MKDSLEEQAGEDIEWRSKMFDWRDQLVRQAQYEDRRLEAEKERLLNQIKQGQLSPEPNPVKKIMLGLLARFLQALHSRKSTVSDHTITRAEGTGKYVSS